MAPPATKTAAIAAAYKTFDDLEGKFCDDEVLVRLIHFWEARNFKKGNVLMGLKLLLIDTTATTIQGFIPAKQAGGYKDLLKSGSVYVLKKFILNPCKTLYKVSSHRHAICFSGETCLVEEAAGKHKIDAQQFRLKTFQDLAPIADTAVDLYDIIGHIRLLSGDNLQGRTPFSEGPQPTGGNSTEMVFLHVQLEDGETVRVYLWDKIAANFRTRWNDSETKPSVLLLTTINPKTIRTAVALSSTSATRVFFDTDIAETTAYLTRLGHGGPNIPTLTTSSSAVTKVEIVTLNEIHQFIQTEPPQTARFICTATIVDVVGQRPWNFISCTGCRFKMDRSETKLICTNPKCKIPNNVGIIRYRFEITVRDNTGLATFVIFDDEGQKLAGKSAADAMTEMREEAANEGHEGHLTATPTCLLDIAGRKCKFQVKITEYNFSASRNTIAVSRKIEDTVAEEPIEVCSGCAEGPSGKSYIAAENEAVSINSPKTDETTEAKQKRARFND